MPQKKLEIIETLETEASSCRDEETETLRERKKLALRLEQK